MLQEQIGGLISNVNDCNSRTSGTLWLNDAEVIQVTAWRSNVR